MTLTQTPENTYEFFLVVAPGLESLAEKEIVRWTPAPVKRERGGLTVHLPLIEGLELNRVLKIPTRVLVRLAAFGCRDFPKLFKKTAGFPWAEWVSGPVDFQASSHKSRLFIKKRIEQTCREGFEKAQRTGGAPTSKAAPTSEPVSVLVRFLDDVCTFSLDTSGERLHKRGQKTLTSEAPLRETIAAALLAFMGEPPGPTTLIDPMVGSGTFFFEAAGGVSDRDYAFETIPKYANQKTEPKLVPKQVPPPTTAFQRFIGFEIDAKTAEAARENLRAIEKPVTIEVADIFDAKALTLEGSRWLIANPPYGERLKIEGRLRDYYELLFESCERVAKPDRACFLLPDTAKPEKLRAPKRWRLERTLKFQNGGLPVTALLFSSTDVALGGLKVEA